MAALITSLADMLDLVRESKRQRILYVSERDFNKLLEHTNKNTFVRHDDEGIYLWFMTTKVRPMISVVDLSDSDLFNHGD